MSHFFPTRGAALVAALAVTLAAAPALTAQDATPAAQQTTAPAAPTLQPDQAPAAADETLSNTSNSKKKPAKVDRIQQTKDTKVAAKKEKKLDPLVGKDMQLPDKQLYDKALAQEKSGHFDIARLDLQTMLNTYPDSPYQMRAKLAVADSWYHEGGTAALTQAEQEYSDFITFFPNVPEAAEAQMRIGDIYFKQMDVPDRDYSKGVHAQDAYRTMLKQYPDAPKEITAEARQKLREVQEMLATREASLGQFYAAHANWPAAIARYQTVIDTYPQYSHMDDTLIGLGDCYAAESTIVRTQGAKMGEAARAALLAGFDGKAAAAYTKVVVEHAAAPHVEDAKERLAAMNLPVPTPTKAQVAASEALEGSRAQYDLKSRIELLILHKPDTVLAAGAGDPPLDDATPTTAPTIVRGLQNDYLVAATGVAPAGPPRPVVDAAPVADPANPAPPPAAAAPLSLSDVPAAGQGAADTTTGTMTETTPAGSDTPGSHLGVEVVTPTTAPSTGPHASDRPSATGAQDPNFGLNSVGPKDTGPLPAIEKPADAPDQVNDVSGKPQPAAQVKDPNAKKNPKAPPTDKNDESSSKKKPKKGLDKINPF